MHTTINFHQIVSVRAEKRIENQGTTWRYIVFTDIDGNETKITMFPAAEDKPEQISIVDEERQG